MYRRSQRKSAVLAMGEVRNMALRRTQASRLEPCRGSRCPLAGTPPRNLKKMAHSVFKRSGQSHFQGETQAAMTQVMCRALLIIMVILNAQYR